MRWYVKYDGDETTQGPFSEKILIDEGRRIDHVRPALGGPWRPVKYTSLRAPLAASVLARQRRGLVLRAVMAGTVALALGALAIGLAARI